MTEPKTKKSIRTVYIDDMAIRLLVDDHKKHPSNPYLFPSSVTGGMYGPDCVGRIHKKLLKRAGIEEHVRFHDLRRTFATMALQNGVDPKTVSGMLGHYSAEFTLDIYTNVTKEMQKEAQTDRRLHGGYPVGQKKARRRSGTLSGAPAFARWMFPALSPCGSGCGSGNFGEYVKWIKVTKIRRFIKKIGGFVVRVAGFEPTASWSRTMRATNCATPGLHYILS